MRGLVGRLVFPRAAAVARIGAGTAGGAQKATVTFIIAGAADPTYLDPALVSDGESFRVTEQIFEGLVSLRPGSTVVQAGLATKWGSKNGKDWTFTLRHGVKFHDGTASTRKRSVTTSTASTTSRGRSRIPRPRTTGRPSS